MARRRSTAADDPLADLAKKLEILERELAAQRAAMEKLKALGAAGPTPRRSTFAAPAQSRRARTA